VVVVLSYKMEDVIVPGEGKREVLLQWGGD